MATIDDIHEARQAHLEQHPFDPFKVPILTYDGKGNPIGMTGLPDLGELNILGCRLGMEYLAICHDDDEVRQWIHRCIDLAKQRDQLGMLLGNVLQGMNLIIASNLQTDMFQERRDTYAQLAVEAWEKDFGESGFDDD